MPSNTNLDHQIGWLIPVDNDPGVVTECEEILHAMGVLCDTVLNLLRYVSFLALFCMVKRLLDDGRSLCFCYKALKTRTGTLSITRPERLTTIIVCGAYEPITTSLFTRCGQMATGYKVISTSYIMLVPFGNSWTITTGWTIISEGEV